MPNTHDLGQYLGMKILHKRIDKNTFVNVLEKVSSKLAGWKGRNLSFAGRITLTKSVLASIPVHSMSTICLPSGKFSDLDKIPRNFIWGSSTEQRRLHLIAWDRVCLLKWEGGLGIRTVGAMNKSLIAKVDWRLLHDTESLWARVVRSKYKIGDLQDPSWMVVQSNWSPTWRSVLIGIREVIIQGHSWVLGDGRKTNFWTDKWLMNTPLCDVIQGKLPVGFETVKARDLWEVGRGWMPQQIVPYVSENKWLELASVVVDNVTGARDRLSWGATSNGQFTVKSAYDMITQTVFPRQDMENLYKSIWRVNAPERVRTFLWLVSHQVIMTNDERHRRHLCSTNLCQICKGGVEDTLHVLRDCLAMEGIWTRIMPTSYRNSFFSMSLLEWLYANLKSEVLINDIPWATTFAVSVWWAWKWRCWNVFGVNRACRDRVRFIKDRAAEVMKAKKACAVHRGGRGRIERMISWTPPRVGWFKLNTDGALRGNPGLATAGGVLRDGEGEWYRGFALNIGRCSAPLAELWGVYYGLCIAWEERVTQLEVEIDSEIVVTFLQTGIESTHPLSFLVRLCHGFLVRDWIVRVSHTYREANRLADGLANYAFTLSFGLHKFDFAPLEVDSIVRENAVGVSTARFVRL